jgi:hypothetical protein
MKLINILIVLCLIALYSSILRKNRKTRFRSPLALAFLSSEATLAKFSNDQCNTTAGKIMELMADNVEKVNLKQKLKKAENPDLKKRKLFGQEVETKEEMEVDYAATQEQTNSALDRIPGLLNQGKIVKLEIKTDHHFVLLKDGRQNASNRIFIWQSFVDTYHLGDWIANSPNQGSNFTAEQIVAHLKTILDYSKPKVDKREALLALFAFDRSAVQTAVVNWFGEHITLFSIWNGDLAAELPKKSAWEKVKDACWCCGKKIKKETKEEEDDNQRRRRR